MANGTFKLPDSLQAWGSDEFEATLRQEIINLDAALLPLQQALTQSSHVSDSGISVLILNVMETSKDICVKTGIFYSGVIAGSCCADDPTPLSELSEYCDLLFKIDKLTAATTVTLLDC